MIKAERKDKARVIEILVRSFADDPHTNWLIGADQKGKEKRLRALINVAFEDALINREVYLSDDGTGCALWKKGKAHPVSFGKLISRLQFALAFGWQKTKTVLEMEKYATSFHPAEDFVYLWFIGVLPEGQGKGVGSRLLDPVLEECGGKMLPVYLQTSNAKNVLIYERKGFRTYHEWSPEDESDLKVRFMRTG